MIFLSSILDFYNVYVQLDILGARYWRIIPLPRSESLGCCDSEAARTIAAFFDRMSTVTLNCCVSWSDRQLRMLFLHCGSLPPTDGSVNSSWPRASTSRSCRTAVHHGKSRRDKRRDILRKLSDRETTSCYQQDPGRRRLKVAAFPKLHSLEKQSPVWVFTFYWDEKGRLQSVSLRTTNETGPLVPIDRHFPKGLCSTGVLLLQDPPTWK